MILSATFCSARGATLLLEAGRTAAARRHGAPDRGDTAPSSASNARAAATREDNGAPWGRRPAVTPTYTPASAII